MKDNIKKSTILAIVICLVGLTLVGGTFAYFTMSFNATNSSIVTDTRCFSVNYTDNTDQITGVLWPSANDGGGLSGSVTVQANSTCGTNGNGKLYLNVDTENSTLAVNPADYIGYRYGHCENKYTLETLNDLEAASCRVNNNTIWREGLVPLKYAIYDSAARTNLYASGYIDSSFIGTDKEILSDFSIGSTSKTFYIYIWLDGNLTGNIDMDYSFSAKIKLGATQVTSEAREYPGDNYVVINNDIYTYSTWQDVYQRIDYIESTGTQYINTGINVFAYPEFQIHEYIEIPTFSNNNIIFGYSGGNNTYKSWADASGNWKTIYNNVSCGNDIQLSNSDENYLYLSLGSYNNETYISGEGGVNYDYYQNPISLALQDGELYLFYDGTNFGKYQLHYTFYVTMRDASGHVFRYEFCPVRRKADNAVGLIDAYSGIFYTNAGTGNFVAGPDVDRGLW